MPSRQHIYYLVVGICIASAVLALAFMFASGFKVGVNDSEGRIRSLLLIGTLSLSTAVFEELIFRYWLTTYLTKVLKSILAGILLSSTAFALLHMGNNHVTFFAICSHLVGGIIYATTFVLSKSIWLPIGIHFGWNFTQYLFSLPMSGSLKNGLFLVELPQNDLLYGGAYGIEAGWVGVACRMVVFAVCLGLIYGGRRRLQHGHTLLRNNKEHTIS